MRAKELIGILAMLLKCVLNSQVGDSRLQCAARQLQIKTMIQCTFYAIYFSLTSPEQQEHVFSGHATKTGAATSTTHVHPALVAHRKVLRVAASVSNRVWLGRGAEDTFGAGAFLRALRLKGGSGRPDPEEVAQRRALVQELREAAAAEQRLAPEHNAIDEILRQRASNNLPLADAFPFNFTSNDVEGADEEEGSSMEEEQNIFVRVPSRVDPVYDEEYAEMREEAIAKGETPPPIKVYHTAYWTEAGLVAEDVTNLTELSRRRANEGDDIHTHTHTQTNTIQNNTHASTHTRARAHTYTHNTPSACSQYLHSHVCNINDGFDHIT